MSVYVDNARAPFRRMLMCHMIADSSEELHDMALMIGVSQTWVQKKGEHDEHFDVCLSKRAEAIQLGAIAIAGHALASILRARRNR